MDSSLIHAYSKTINSYLLLFSVKATKFNVRQLKSEVFIAHLSLAEGVLYNLSMLNVSSISLSELSNSFRLGFNLSLRKNKTYKLNWMSMSTTITIIRHYVQCHEIEM